MVSRANIFAAAAGASILASATTAQAQQVPTTLVETGEFQLVTQREAGDRDPNGPEFVVKYSKMYAGDYTYQGLGRGIDCDYMVAGPKSDGSGALEWKLTGAFIAQSYDIADGSAFDDAFDQDKRAVVGATFINDYKRHVNDAHHPYNEQDAVSGYCNLRYPPTNDNN
jgi:hypothetical protein